MGGSNFAYYSFFKNRVGAYFGEPMAVKLILIWVISVLLSATGGYYYGKSQTKTQIITREVEVIKYVAAKRAKIQSLPNASRTELIELMHKGLL